MKFKQLVLILFTCAIFLASCSRHSNLPEGMPPGLWRSRGEVNFLLGLKDDQRAMIGGAVGTYSLTDEETLRLTLGAGASTTDFHVTVIEPGKRVLVDINDWGYRDLIFELLVPDNGPAEVRAQDLMGTWVHSDSYYEEYCAFNKPPSECVEQSLTLIFEGSGRVRMLREQDFQTGILFNREGTFELLTGKLLFDFGDFQYVIDEIYHFGNVMVLDGSLVLVRVP